MISRRKVLALTPAVSISALISDALASGVGTEIPVETLFRKPAYGAISLSPSQRFMAAVAPGAGRQQLVIIDLEKRTGARITNLERSDVRTVAWASDERLLFTTGDQQGLEFRSDGGLFAVDRDGRNGRTLVEPFAGAGGFVPRITTPLRRIRGATDEYLVSANDRSADSQSIYRMNIQTGRKTLVSFNSPGNVERWMLDRDDLPRAAMCVDIEKRQWWFSYLPKGPDAKWRTLAKWDEQLTDAIVPLAFDPADPSQMFVASNAGRDTVAIFRFDPEAGKLGELVLADERHDLASLGLIGGAGGAGLLFGGSEDTLGKLLGIRYNADKPRTVWFDEEAARLQAAVDGGLPGAVNTFDLGAKRALVFSRSDTNPGAYYLFDRERRTLEDTGIRTRPQIDPRQMRPMQPVTWQARDGLRIDGYLTLPSGFRAGSPVPLILHPHGGPWVRDSWGFNPEVQFMANRGFAVLQVNFRGSTGYGTRHLKSSYRQWGGAMIDDMIDGVEWAIREGYADRARIAAYGASYGGYATLMAMVKRPELFKWGVNYVGVTDMTVHQNTQPAQASGNFSELAKVLNGDQRSDAALFEAHSPARQVARIAGPVLHAYGGEDRNVDYANGRTIRAAFEKAGKPFEWMYVADEAHGYRQDKNVFEFYRRFEAFAKANTPPK